MVPSSSLFLKTCLWSRNQFTKGCHDLGIKQVTSVVSCNSQPAENITVGSTRNALGKQARQLGEVRGVKKNQATETARKTTTNAHKIYVARRREIN